MNVFHRFHRYSSFGQAWIYLYVLLAFISHAACVNDIYKSCQDVSTSLGSSAKDKVYQIMTSSGHAVNIYCHGLNSNNPREYLILPTGRSKNYATVYDYISLPYECHNYNPIKRYAKRGRTQFDKVAFDIAANSIIRNDFTFAHGTGPNNISFGSAGGMYSPLPKCSPHGIFSIDLTGTPFIIHKKVRWQWEGQFQDGSRNGSVNLHEYQYLGCYRDSYGRALPMAALSSNTMTIEKCIQHCDDAGYYYAGLESGRICYCGNDYKKYGVSKGCVTPCSGQKYRKCGGRSALSVYTAGKSHYRVGRCDGYPAKCYPILTDGQEKEFLFLQFNPTHPCRQKICGFFGTCVATTSVGFFCKCASGFSGGRCDRRTVMKPTGQTCPPDYQPESCACIKSDCYGAKLENGYCRTQRGKPQLTCGYGKSPTVVITEVHSIQRSVSCPSHTKIISCTYWDGSRRRRGNGKAGIRGNRCYSPCTRCTAHATCQQYFCGCKNGGTCDIQSDTCKCRPGYTGASCEEYDYCTYWERAHKKAACSDAGICRSVQQILVNATGGDAAGNVCQLPFTIQGQTYTRCVRNNKIGPPYSCGGSFDGNNTYIDLGKWSPGPNYTIAAWVKPSLMDHKNRLIAGGIHDCRNFGMAYQNGKFQAFYQQQSSNAICTTPLPSSDQYPVGLWYSVAVVNNGSYITLIVNGKIANSASTQPKFLGNANGFWIGGGPCCAGSSFSGMIKNVKVWNQALPKSDIAANFKNNDVNDSPDQVAKKGLVGHYELGDIPKANCSGIDHNNEDWIPEHQAQLSGRHCNIKRFVIKKYTTVYVHHWNGSAYGNLEVEAQGIFIEGYLNANGAGYRGGQTSNTLGADGSQGDSYSSKGGKVSVKSNAGGGGGGLGESKMKVGGRPGGGGSHASVGTGGSALLTKTNGSGEAGQINTYSGKFSLLYMGSGGGSGGNPLNTDSSPKGGDGGNGGGAISLTSETQVVVNGMITAQGEDAVGDSGLGSCFMCPKACKTTPTSCDGYNPNGCYDTSGPGGGGSGGSIHISAEFVNIGMNRLNTRGGYGGQGARMCGGQGGVGRILIETSFLKGSVNKYYGILNNLTKDDTFKDFSNIGRTVTGGQKKTNENVVYLGCFADTEESLLNLKQKVPFQEVTPENCQAVCSKKKFKYSGTKGGNECFCDNKLDSSHRVDESKCRSKCSGSSTQLCGGPGTLLVFGLRQQLYGIGFNGITDECKGWCVTAGSETKAPKWGDCLDEEETLSMNLTCQCPGGKYGSGCEKDCLSTKWGIDCHNNCTCKSNTSCNSIDGNCKCPKGWSGYSCDIRSKNYCVKEMHYGPSCEPCQCSGRSCDPVTGACHSGSVVTTSGMSGGAIAGVVIGVLAMIAVIAFGVVLLIRNPYNFRIGPIKYENHENEVNIPTGFGDEFLEDVVNEVNAAASSQFKGEESKDIL